jgi:hypothetical protein
MAVLFILLTRAEVVELVDALRSGRSGSNPVGVRVPPSAPFLTILDTPGPPRVKYPVYLLQPRCVEEIMPLKFSSPVTSQLFTAHSWCFDGD